MAPAARKDQGTRGKKSPFDELRFFAVTAHQRIDIRWLAKVFVSITINFTIHYFVDYRKRLKISLAP